ncbi:hypothetical protein KP509_34G008300 [Ceratopteris richardii]|uniref:Phosphatidylethanolamine-binding protein n=1 Tax=Ceratopteris richardii TaxID=49495 RepID=A0A8T2QH49_CERRI|nr:hypothetical protein KP509_34G008300 [Ceratopteris richardii]
MIWTKLWIAVAGRLAMISVIASTVAGRGKHEVIPPCLDAFGAPRIGVNLSFNGSDVRTGQLLPINLTVSPPHVSLDMPSSLARCRLTLVMVNPDAPSPTYPYLSLFLHWIVVNIAPAYGPYEDIVRSGEEAVTYTPPAPPTGTHRYFLLVFKQT